MNKNSEGPRIGQMGYEIKASRPCHQKKNKKMDLNIILRNTKFSLTEMQVGVNITYSDLFLDGNLLDCMVIFKPQFDHDNNVTLSRVPPVRQHSERQMQENYGSNVD